MAITKHFTCQDHKPPKRVVEEEKRPTIEERRLYFKIGDTVKANSDYHKYISKNPEWEGGTIIEFDDPGDWANKDKHSLANVEMPCGCTHIIDTGWLAKA